MFEIESGHSFLKIINSPASVKTVLEIISTALEPPSLESASSFTKLNLTLIIHCLPPFARKKKKLSRYFLSFTTNYLNLCLK